MAFGMMPFATGDFTSGFNEETTAIRQENTRRAEVQAARDLKIFEALANADDPDVRAAAVTGLLTNNHPARGLDKFFEKSGTHPAYETIRNLVADEKHLNQAFPGETEAIKRRGVAEGEAKTDVFMSGAKRAGLTPEQTTSAFMAMHGAAPRSQNAQRGTLKFNDGTTSAGYFDPVTRQYFDDNGQMRNDVAAFSASGAFGGTSSQYAGSFMSKTTAKDWMRQFPGIPLPPGTKPDDILQFRVDGSTGKPIGTPIVTVAPAGPQPNFTAVYTPGGIQGFNTKTNTLMPTRGGDSTTRASTPDQSLQAARDVEASILRLHPQPKQVGMLPPDPRDVEAWRLAVDEEAKKYGYANFAEVQAAVGAAGRGVSATTPPPPSPGGASAAPPAAPGGPAPNRQPTRDPAVDAILKQLGR